MVITDRKLIFCHAISEGNVEKKILTREYNNRTVYECFNNPFISHFGSPYLNPPLVTIDDRPRSHKIPCFPPDLLLATISFASEKSVSTLTTPSASQKLLLLPSDYHNHCHITKKDEPNRVRVKIGYCSRKYN